MTMHSTTALTMMMCAGAAGPCMRMHPDSAAGGASGSCCAECARHPRRKGVARAHVAIPWRDQAPPQRPLGGALLGQAAGAAGVPGCAPACLPRPWNI